MQSMKIFGLSCAAAGALAIGLIGASPAEAGEVFQKPDVLFIQQDRVITFQITPPNPPSQPLGGGVGSHVGTATGAINGTTVVNFKFTFTTVPGFPPGNCAQCFDFDFDNRVGITDTDGDQIIFKNVGTGKFRPSLIDPTLGGDPGASPFQVFGNGPTRGTGGPLKGTYEVVATSGKYTALYTIGQKFPYRAISFNPATPPNTPGTTGSSYVEILKR
jgi:hypothetical protein